MSPAAVETSDVAAHCRKPGAAFIIMHMQGTPRTMQRAPYPDVVAEVADFFRQQHACAIEFGVDPMTLAFDPGIGFGKTLEHNLSSLKNLPRLRVHDRPLVIGVSRKSFLGKISGHNGSIHHRLLPDGRVYFLAANERRRCFTGA